MTSTTTAVRSERLRALPPYLFAQIARRKREKVAAGRDVIDLGIGDPDRPTPRFIIDALREAAGKAEHHKYPPDQGTAEFRQAAARFMQRRYGVEVDPNRHVQVCIGSKDGISHLPLAVADPGDVVCVPDPNYPVYVAGATFAGAKIHRMPLTAEAGWLPRLDQIPGDVAEDAKILWVNYPNNPTSACADVGFFDELVRFCSKHRVIAASDQAYSEIYFDRPPPSIWQAPSADIENTPAVEFHSLSKTFNMTGWRIAFAVGHEEVVSALGDLKANCDSGVFGAVQEAGIAALDGYDREEVAEMRRVYRERRDVLVPGLRRIGCVVDEPRAGFFVWAKCLPGPDGEAVDSMEFASRCLEEADVVVVPGSGFSEHTRRYFRIALTVEVDRFRDAVERLERLKW